MATLMVSPGLHARGRALPYLWAAVISHQHPCDYIRELGLALLEHSCSGWASQQVSFSDQALYCSLCLACHSFVPIQAFSFVISQAPTWPGTLAQVWIRTLLDWKGCLGDEVFSALQKTRSGQFGGTSRASSFLLSVLEEGPCHLPAPIK